MSVSRRALLLAAAAVALAVLGPATAASAQEGWSIERFHAEILVRADAAIEVDETIAVDFGALERHGILREIPVRYRYDDDHDRVYDLRVRGVSDASGRPWPYERSERGGNVVLRIGDPDRTVTGKQTYFVSYEVRGALNAFSDHDELFWNVNGRWPVPTASAGARVRLERGAMERVACYEGGAGSTSPCRGTLEAGRGYFSATRPLAEREQLSIVVGLPKGAVAEPAPLLENAVRGPDDVFRLTPATLGASAAVLLLGIGVVLARWLAAGRDRRFLRRYYLDPASPETVVGPLARDTIVTEYEPPELLGPAEVGLLLDEAADPKDLTATIVHLAVRGYLAIEEIPATGLFGRKDWVLRRRKAADDRLAPYERRILEGLFDDGDTVKLSELRGSFHGTLHAAQKELYRASVERSWFPADPFRTRLRWQLAGFGLGLLGVYLVFGLGLTMGAGIVGVAVALVGVLLFAASRAMPSRTAHGRELLLRILGFRRYMETAETERQRFAEREGIFAAYLPYAIVFGSVTRWARAFEGIDAQAATAGWYTGAGVSDLGSFSSGLSSMSSSVSSAISSTPGSSGSSGFSGGGGSAGGGGGGGGGGSW